MSEPTAPTAADVRTAADALKTAIDAHLAAVQARSDESDPAVRTAFLAMAAAAEAYDDALYDVYNEVTPFEIPSQYPEDQSDPDNPEAISVLIRRDYQIEHPGRLLGAARGLAAGAVDPEVDISTVAGSLAALFDVFDPDEIHNRSDELGLLPGDGTTWVLAADPDVLGEEQWFEDPFSDTDPERVVCRFDLIGDEDEEDEEYFDTFVEDEAEDEIDGIEVV
ncbi:MAG: hypothetical protein HOV87_02300 [Catenulispora sp.]|nr:hypothetical protein [Catenulispora sp.]